MPLVKCSDDNTKGDDHDDKKVDDAVAAQQERADKIKSAIEGMDTEPNLKNVKAASGINDVTKKELEDAVASLNG